MLITCEPSANCSAIEDHSSQITKTNIIRMKGTSLAVKGLRFCASNAGDAGSIPGWGTKIPHATQQGQKIK